MKTHLTGCQVPMRRGTSTRPGSVRGVAWRGVAEMLNEPHRREMQAAFEDWMNGFGTSLGVVVKCEYLVTIGVTR